MGVSAPPCLRPRLSRRHNALFSLTDFGLKGHSAGVMGSVLPETFWRGGGAHPNGPQTPPAAPGPRHRGERRHSEPHTLPQSSWFPAPLQPPGEPTSRRGPSPQAVTAAPGLGPSRSDRLPEQRVRARPLPSSRAPETPHAWSGKAPQGSAKCF